MSDVLQSLAKNQCPKKVVSPSAWQQSFWSNLPSFFTYTDAKTNNGVECVGSDAWTRQIKALTDATEKDIRAVEALECWLPFMSLAMDKEIADL
eukprot:2959900-Amphidinium_carterae.1